LATKQLSQSFLCTDIQIAIQTFSKKCLKPKIPFFGGYSEEVTPVPIPNTEVKLFSADGTAREAWWESRTPPKILYKACHPKDDRLFCLFDPQKPSPLLFKMRDQVPVPSDL
jgi:hypothetical protein